MFSFRVIWTLVFQVRKAEECFKNCLVGHTSRSMEDNGANNDLKCLELAQKVSEKNFRMLPRNFSCDILVKKVDAFFHYLKNLPEFKVKGD